MQLKMISDEKLKVTLEAKDMADMKVIYNDLECDNIKTKRLVFQLLTRAKLECGFNCKNGKLLIEAFPETKGGCVLYFTVVEEQKKDNNKLAINHLIIMKTGNFNVLLAAAKAVEKSFEKYVLRTRLFKVNNVYVLTIFAKKDNDKTFINMLSEFGETSVADSRFYTFLNEHAVEIIPTKAVEILAMLY